MKNMIPTMIKDNKARSIARWLTVMGVILGGKTLPALALEVSGPGFTPLGEVTASSTSTYTGGLAYGPSNNNGINLYIGNGNDSSTVFCSSALPNISTPDGSYYGWELSANSGVYGIIYNSSVAGWLWTSNSYTDQSTITATWDATGKASTNGTNNRANCYTSVPRIASGSPANFYLRTGDNTLSGQIKYGVYVDPTNPKAGTYSLNFYIGKYLGTFTQVLQTFDVALTACTVATPSQIQFGTVDAGSTAPVISQDGGMDISCSGRSPTVNVSYAVQAVSAIQSATQLVISNTQNQTLGTVRGFIGTNADSQVGCNDTATSLQFGAPATSLLTAVPNNAGNTIPLKWVLCPVSTAAPGQGSASATLNIIWQ